MITREEAKEYFEKASDNSLNYHDSTDVISINSVNIILNEVYDSFEQHIKSLEAQLNTEQLTCDGCKYMTSHGCNIVALCKRHELFKTLPFNIQANTIDQYTPKDTK